MVGFELIPFVMTDPEPTTNDFQSLGSVPWCNSFLVSAGGGCDLGLTQRTGQR
jgi:hypothetical protein